MARSSAAPDRGGARRRRGRGALLFVPGRAEEVTPAVVEAAALSKREHQAGDLPGAPTAEQARKSTAE